MTKMPKYTINELLERIEHYCECPSGHAEICNYRQKPDKAPFYHCTCELINHLEDFLLSIKFENLEGE